MTILQARRKGFTLLEVAIATVIVTVGTLGMSVFFKNIYEQLSPRGETGGLRRYMMAEEMLRTQAEGLRALRQIPHTLSQCKLITEPPNMGYSLTLARTNGPTQANEQLYYFDVQMDHSIGGSSRNIGTLSMSTLRSIGNMEGQNEKIGL